MTFSHSDKSIQTFDIVLNTLTNTGNANNYSYLKIGSGIEIRSNQQNQIGTVIIDGKENAISNANGKNNGNRANDVWTIHAEINTATNTLTSLTLSGSLGTKKASFTLSEPTPLDASSTYNTVTIGVNRAAGNLSVGLASIKIDEEKQSVTTAEYKVKYIDENGKQIKDEDSRNGVVGQNATISSSDETSFFNTDESVKYIYVSDDSEGKTIAADGSTVVTITFKEVSKYIATLKAVDSNGNTLKEDLASGTNFEGEETTIYYPKSLTVNGTIYNIDANKAEPYYGVKVTEEGTTNITYSAADYQYFAECESLQTSSSNAVAAHGGVTGRYSNGDAVRLNKGAYLYSEALKGGKATITVWGRNQSRSTGSVDLYTRDADGSLSAEALGTITWNAAESATKQLTEVTIPNGSSLVIKNPNADYTNNIELDYITVQYAPITVSLNTTSGLASFSSTSTVTVPEDVSIYVAATPSDNTVAVTKVNTTVVPANTGVILYKKDGGDVTLTIGGTADQSLYENNALVGTGADTKDGDGSSVLVLVKGEAAFAPLASGSTVAAGKAYLPTTTTREAKLNIVFDGAVTGISTINRAQSANSDIIYNLAGQRVGKNYKGVVIVNGKKVIR